MKLLCVGDAHITDNRPVNRTDNYWAAVRRKLDFIFLTGEKHNVDLYIFPGDLTDTPNISYSEFSELALLFQENLDFAKREMLTVFGQHDMRYRRKENTALWALNCASANLDVIDAGQFYEDVYIQGCSYGEEVPPPADGFFNVLVIHKMIVEEKLWSAQEGHEHSNLFLRQHNFDLIVSGDNHQGFITQSKGGRLLVNCGAMMRDTIALIDHKPFVVIYDTKTKKHEKVFIPIKPAEEVFRMEKVTAEKERNASLDSFITGLSEQKEIGLLFEDNLQSYAKLNDVGEEIMNEIYESFGVPSSQLGKEN